MKTKRFLSLLLLMLIFLASCGEASPNHEEDHVLNGDIEQTGSENLPLEQGNGYLVEEAAASYWEYWVKDVSSGGFKQASSESFVFENDGYVIELTLDKWAATRGSSEYVLHPAGNGMPLPQLKPSDCVIPFVITAKTATEDIAFTTDFSLIAIASRGVYHFEPSSFESAVESQTKLLNDMKLNSNIDDLASHNGENLIQEYMSRVPSQTWWLGFSESYSETKLGDEQVIIGYYVINDYYSPKFPDGNLELFPSGSAMMYVQVWINSNLNEKYVESVMR